MRSFESVSRTVPSVVAVIFVCSFGVVAGCASIPPEVKNAETEAERLYLLGEHRMDRGDYSGAIEKYDAVRNEHPYSRYATEADLRIADAYFEQDQYSSAAEQYRTFIKLHPKHEEIPYARFRIGEAMYEKMPNDWFFLPPTYERDLTSTRSAVDALRTFLEKHPESEKAARGRKMLSKARRRLADHEVYVANFYLERDNPEGAKMRLEYLLNNYSGLGLDARALYMLAKSHHRLGDIEEARTALEDLLEYHSDSSYAERAKRYMKTL